jgi:diguanylate cyclase (GGDEF)-like protein
LPSMLTELDPIQIRMLLLWGVAVLALMLGITALIKCKVVTLHRFTWWRRGRNILFGVDNEQRAIFLRFMVGLLNAMTGVLVLNFGVDRGAIDPVDCQQLTHWALGVSLFWLVVMRSGFNRRFPDPSLAEPQMVSAIFFLGWGYMIGGPGSPIALMLLFIILMFSMFHATTKQLVRCSLLSVTVFGYAFWHVAHLPTQEPFQALMQAVYFGVLVIILVSMCVLMTYLSNIRARSSQRKQSLAEALARIRELAIRDELTGLFNRRHILELLHTERSRSDRTAQPWCLCMIDVDHFKVINDRHGHGVGDEVLRSLALIIRDGLRDCDHVARWGGEEFLVLLPNTGLEEAVLVVERIRQSLLRTGVSRAVTDLRVTLSAGVSQVLAEESLPQTIDRADQALYHAKSEGRNCTQAAAMPAGQSTRAAMG